MSDKELAWLGILRDLDQRGLMPAAAAQLLGLGQRQGSGLLKVYRTEGSAGLISKRRGRCSDPLYNRFFGFWPERNEAVEQRVLYCQCKRSKNAEYCGKQGMPVGSAKYESYVRDLAAIRVAMEQRLREAAVAALDFCYLNRGQRCGG